MTNVEALKACYVAIGGSAADVADAKTTAAVIEAISTIASGGGGGGGAMTVNIAYDVEAQTLTLDKTFAEIKAAVGAGMAINFVGDMSTPDEDNYLFLHMTSMFGNADQNSFSVGAIGYGAEVTLYAFNAETADGTLEASLE